MTTEDGIRAAVGAWLRSAIGDAERRGLTDLTPMLEGLAASTIALRLADWNDHVPDPGTANGSDGGATEAAR